VYLRNSGDIYLIFTAKRSPRPEKGTGYFFDQVTFERKSCLSPLRCNRQFLRIETVFKSMDQPPEADPLGDSGTSDRTMTRAIVAVRAV